jgi:colanic acid biosynthesis glycosyl transferase WcaI
MKQLNNTRVLLIGGNYYPEPTGIGKYNGEMVDVLASRGYDCTVITSYPYYPYWKVQEPYARKWFWFKKEVKQGSNASSPIHIYRCPQYVPANPTGMTRILLDFTFCFSSLLKLVQLSFNKKYDVVITVVPCFQVGLLGWLYKLVRGGKFLYHIQDLQIDAARDLKMIRSERVINCMLAIEKFILKKADIVSSISTGMVKKIYGKYPREVVLFPNWTDTSNFYHIPDKEELKKEFGFAATDKIILYSGAIGEKQGLENILYAAKKMESHTQLKFVICGSGPYKEKLKALADELGLTNIIFLALQPLEKFNRFLNMPDIHLVLQKSGAADLVMPSKLTNILAVGGLCIVAAPEESTLYEILSLHHMSILIEPDNLHSLVNALQRGITLNDGTISANARRYAEQHLSVEQVFSRYTQYLQ